MRLPRIAGVGGIQFRTFPDVLLTPQSAFAVMNVLRVVIEMIDREFVATLMLYDVVDDVAAQVFERVEAHDRSPERLARKVRSALLD